MSATSCRACEAVTAYGLSRENNFYAENIIAKERPDAFSRLRARQRHDDAYLPSCSIRGHAQRINALAAIAVATEVQVADEAVVEALAGDEGRRSPFPALWRSGPASGGSFTLVKRARPSPGGSLHLGRSP